MSQQKQQSTSPAPKDVKNQIPPPFFESKEAAEQVLTHHFSTLPNLYHTQNSIKYTP